jgi:hypothetical protein
MGKQWLPAQLRKLWDRNRNGSSKGVRVRSRHQFYFKASCGKHSRLLQPASAAKALKRQGGLRCPICQPSEGQVSRFVPAVQAAVQNTGFDWQAEVYCLSGHSSPADIWLPEQVLAIQVDGPQHADVSMFGTPAEEQEQIDARFDNGIIRAGQRALRIHWRDAALPSAAAKAVQQALNMCRLLPGASFVMYSDSYGRNLKWTEDEEE